MTLAQNTPPSPHYHGHRQRLKDRFIKDPTSLPDYEILELVLYWIYPRRDVKAWAKTLLLQHGSLHRLMHAPQEDCPPSLQVALVLISEYARRVMHYDLKQTSLLNNSQRVVDYCHLLMAQNDVEQFRLFFLDRKYYLISDDIQTGGTLDQISLYPREVVKRALAVNAAFLIMVHNHPSGDPTPSRADIELTNHLKSSLLPFNIRVLDHFIIGKKGYFSFREQGLISD
jgi:DNA repair protein RadC